MWAAVLLCVIAGATGSPLVAVEYDVIVVGMGASGTMAASTLAKAGKRVLAVEAQDRIGGRVRTVPFGDTIVELGAEWIHGSENSTTYKIATENNVTLVVPEDLVDIMVHRSDGSEADSVTTYDLVNFSMGVYFETHDIPEPVGQIITRRLREYIKTKYPSLQNDTDFVDNFLSLMDQIINDYESSNSWNDVSGKSDYETLGGSQEISWGKHGYKTLLDILLNKYKDGPGLPTLTVKLNTEVVQIKWPKDSTGSVEVTTKDGFVYTAGAVIVTVSVGVLKERHSTLFTPPLPENKSHAIEVISIGVVNKVTLRFPYKCVEFTGLGFFWKNEDIMKLTEGERWLTKSEGISRPVSCDTCGTFWFNGDRAKLIETLPEEELKTKLMGVFRQFAGPNVTVPDPIEMIRSSWYSNPFTRGSYSFDGLLTPQNPNAREDLSKPLVDAAGIPRVLFAGEATNFRHFSTVHGALETGEREASRLVASAAA